MLTPRQVNQVHAAIKKQGLTEQDFQLVTSSSQFRMEYLKADFYFLFAKRPIKSAPPVSIVDTLNKVVTLSYPFSVEHVPNLFPNSADITRPVTQVVSKWDDAVKHFTSWLAWIKKEYGPFGTPETLTKAGSSVPPSVANPLASLHPTIQQVASSLYATGHYRQALLDAYIAVDNAVGAKSQLTGSGTRLMEAAFSPGNPVLKIGESSDEQQGFMALFRGAMLAIRNPKAHSLNGTHDAQRALEWLSFASVLLRNLDEATLAKTTPAP